MSPAALPLWTDIADAAPELLAFADEAHQAGVNQFREWLSWIRSYGPFVRAVATAADRLGVPRELCRAVVLCKFRTALDAGLRPADPARPAAAATSPAPDQGKTPATVKGPAPKMTPRWAQAPRGRRGGR
jgi:hypothetical protein